MPHSEETKRRISAALKGKKKSPEHVAKVAASKRGVPQPPDAVARRNAANTGKRRTPEQKARMSAAQIAAWSDEQRKVDFSDARSGMRGKELAAGRYLQDGGYVMLTGIYDHPLSTATGVVAEHRKVLYDKIGPGLHACHWGCGKLLEWGGTEGVCVDHLDSDPSNNDEDNLVPSCLRCNWGRERVY